MKFVALFSLKQSVDQIKLAEIMGRRADYEFPTGVRLIGEYWSGNTDPAVIAIYEAEDSAALMINSVVWIDIFDVQIFPVNTWEEGLDKLTRHLAGE
jgi:hypothetical protein